MSFKVLPYNMVSASAKALAEGLGCKRIRREGKRFKTVDTIINWGNSKLNREIKGLQWLNNPENVAKASNKLKTFKALEGAVSTPQYTTDKEVAKTWLTKGAACVVARATLNGHSGEGITLHKMGDELPDVPMYTRYIPKFREYRLHVMNDQVFFVQEKRRRLEVPDEQVNWQVQNHANGFNYANQNVEIAQEAKDEAVKAINCLGLDFGAVDMIYNLKQDKYFVLEINTAPGLFGTTLEKYVEQFTKLG